MIHRVSIFAVLFSLFSTAAFGAPIISTDPAAAITSDSAVLQGTVNPNGSVIDYFYFQYGLNTGYGQVVYNSPPTDSMVYSANAVIKDLPPNTTYHYRIAAVYNSSTLTVYGSDRTLTTPGEAPDVDVMDVYPTLGELNNDLVNTRIRGTGFNGNTRVSLSLDSGNLRRIIGERETVGPVYAVDIAGSRAYIAVLDLDAGSEDEGLAILDISNPTKPTMVGSFINTGNIEDVAVADEKAYVVTASSLKVVDVDPDSGQYRQTVNTVPMPEQPRAVEVSGNLAFVVAGNSGLQVVNLTTGTISGSYVTGGIALGVAVSGNRAFVADNNGIQVINISNVVNNVEPKLIKSIPTEYYCQNITVSGDYAYATDYKSGTMWDSGSKLLVIDINPDHEATYLKKVAETGILDQPWGVTVAGDIVYIATGDSGLQLVKITPTGIPPGFTLSTLNLVDTPGTARNVAVSGDIAYVADFFEGLQAVDISNPDDRPGLGRYDTPGEAGTVVLYPPTGDPAIAYVADASGGLQIINVSDPSAPQLLCDYTIPMTDHPSRNLFVYDVALSSDGQKAYIITAGVDSSYALYNGLHVIDVSTPSEPVYLYGRDDLESATGIDVAGDYAYVTLYDYLTYGGLLLTVDITGTPLTVVDFDFIKYARDVSVAGSYAYVAGNDGLYVVNIGTPSNPAVVGIVSTPDTALKVDVAGSKAYVADWGNNGGLRIIDVSNPANPRITGSIDTPGSAEGLDAVGGKVYVADRYAGVQVIDVTESAKPVHLDTLETFGRAQDVVVAQGLAYIGDYLSGLSIIPVPVEIVPDSVTTVQINTTLPSPLNTGHYTLRVTNNEKYRELHGAVTFTGEIKLLSSKAIIVAGGGPPVSLNLIWGETRAYANQAYDNLIYQGYRHQDIYYLTDQYQPLHDRYDPDLIDQYANVNAATKANLEYAIKTWARSGGTSGLLVYLVDHGETERFLIRGGSSPQYLSVDALDDWLDTLQNYPDFTGKVILVYDACYSGSFISSKLTPPAGKTRITLTSSTPDQVAYFLENDHSFSSHFWSTFSGKTNNRAIVSDALERATAEMASYQTAQLDANGNGVPNQASDYSALKAYEGTIYSMRRQYSYIDRSKPVVSSVSGNTTLNGSTVTSLTARSVFDLDGDGIARVWAEIIPPDSNPDITGKTVTDLPNITLTGPDPGSNYQKTYSGFTKRGTYIVTYYAEDSSGIYSLPKTSWVRQTEGTIVVVPDQYEVDDTYPGANVIIVNDLSPQNHSFHTSTDVDWVKFYGKAGVVYTIKAWQPTSICDPAIRIFGPDGYSLSYNNAGMGVDETLSWQCPTDGMYFLKLTNNSSHYGANVRYKLKVYNPIAFSLPGYVKGKVSSGVSGISGAVLRGGGGTAVSQGDGSYLLSLPNGSYSVSVSKAGYQSASFSVTVPSGGTTSRNISLAPTAVNSPPTINGSPLTTTYTYEWYSFIPVAADPNGDKLTFSITGKPGWASFNPNTGALSGLPTPAHIGTYGPYTISVSDGSKSVSLPAFTISVEQGSNLPPAIAGSPPELAGVGRLYSFAPMASDPNGDSLSFFIINKPRWANFSGGRLFGVPLAADLGTYGPVTISVKDVKGAGATLPAFSIKVVPRSEIDKYGVLPGVYLLLKE